MIKFHCEQEENKKKRANVFKIYTFVNISTQNRFIYIYKYLLLIN